MNIKMMMVMVVVIVVMIITMTILDVIAIRHCILARESN